MNAAAIILIILLIVIAVIVIGWLLWRQSKLINVNETAYKMINRFNKF